jgi:hypothetical protein
MMIGSALGALAALRICLHILAADPTGTGPGGPYEGMDPRFPAMLEAHEMHLLPYALGLVLAGALLGMLFDRLVRRLAGARAER